MASSLSQKRISLCYQKVLEVLRFPQRPPFISPALVILPSEDAGFYPQNFQTQMLSPLGSGPQRALETRSPRPRAHPLHRGKGAPGSLDVPCCI